MSALLLDTPGNLCGGFYKKVFLTTSVSTRFSVTVTNGTGSGSYEPGDTVAIVANETQEGYQFKEWIASGVTLASPTSSTVTFEMPENNVTIEATYEEIPVGYTPYVIHFTTASRVRNAISYINVAPTSGDALNLVVTLKDSLGEILSEQNIELAGDAEDFSIGNATASDFYYSFGGSFNYVLEINGDGLIDTNGYSTSASPLIVDITEYEYGTIVNSHTT